MRQGTNIPISYTYDENGLRTTKTVGDTTHTYFYAADGTLIRETRSNSDTMEFLYDHAGQPYAFILNGTVYYYVVNLQGDVVRIVDESGNTVVSYVYNAWGKPLSVTPNPTITNAATVAEMNPLRYRGYYYDTETGFYYLQSRYYDPNIGRFINADALASTGQSILGYNMYAYCNNNPVILSDPQGYAAGWTNTVAICDGGTSRFIYNQNHETYERMFLGLASVAHGGCGPISVNNALQLLGNNSASLQEIIDFYKNVGGIRLGGVLGTSFETNAFSNSIHRIARIQLFNEYPSNVTNCGILTN